MPAIASACKTSYITTRIFRRGVVRGHSDAAVAMVHKILAFYLENATEVDRYTSACEAEMEAQRAASPRGPDLAELRRRLAAKQAAGV